jgi:serine/threonine protein phosphatase PrpC
MKFSAGNAQDIGAREEQQDSFGFSDPSDKAFVRHGGFLGVVADGMGGLSNGREAGAAAVRSFLAAYQAKPASESVADALSRSVGEANQAVRQIVQNGSAHDAGTTLAAAVVLDSELYWIAVGDSRIYWVHDNELTQLTADHIYAAMLNREVALGKISRSEAENHPERASLTSYLGQSQPALTDRNLKPLLLHQSDSVLLCSDGFYRALSSDEIVDGFRGNPQHACDSLVQLVLSKHRNQQDNLTVIALKAAKSGSGLAGLSGKARLLLVVAACLILFSTAAGLWYGWHSLVHRSSPPTAPPSAQTPPVTVSQPNPTVIVTPSVTAPPVGTQPLRAAARRAATPEDGHPTLTAKHPPTRPGHSGNPSDEASHASAARERAPSVQTTAPATSEPGQAGQAAPDNNAAPQPSAPESSPRTSPTSPVKPTPQPPPPLFSNRDSREATTGDIADAPPTRSGIPRRGDIFHGFPD